MLVTNPLSSLLSVKGLKLPDLGRVIIGSFGANEAAELHAATGSWPGLLGVEWCRGFGIPELDDLSTAITWREHNPTLIAHAAAGGIVRILTHLPNPCRPRLGGLRDDDADLAAILAPGTAARARWLGVLASIAEGLHDLAAHGITPLFGPLHEMNCRGFWWGKAGLRAPSLYRALWRDMHQVLTEVHGCRDVAWLYAPLANDHDRLHDDLWPGEDVVDVVGLDVYAPSLQPYVPQYRRMVAYGRPFVLSEFAPIAWDAPEDVPSSYDNRTLLSELAEHWPETRSVMFWGGHFAAAKHLGCREMMADPRVLNRAALARSVAR